MNEKAGRENASLASLDQGVGRTIEDTGRFACTGRSDAEPLEQGDCLGSQPTACRNARQRREREVATLKRPVPGRVRIAIEGLVPAR